jgi:hypothetical protein
MFLRLSYNVSGAFLQCLWGVLTMLLGSRSMAEEHRKQTRQIRTTNKNHPKRVDLGGNLF